MRQPICALCSKSANILYHGAHFCRWCLEAVQDGLLSYGPPVDTAPRIGNLLEQVPASRPDALDLRLWTYIEDARRAEA